MSTELSLEPVRQIFDRDEVRKKFQEMLGKNASGFIISVINAVMSNTQLQNAERNSILFAAATAAALDLPIDPNLGFAYIVPYKDKEGVQKAQFQMGYKGYKQLALRSGEFRKLHCTDVREGEIVKQDRLTGTIEFNWLPDDERNKHKVVGYVGYFELSNGFSKSHYMTVAEIEGHAKRFSKTYKKGFGIWQDDFDAMARKTVTKLLLSKGDAPLSIQMRQAITTDQAVVKNWDGTDVEYVDNDSKPAHIDKNALAAQKEDERIKEWIANAKSALKLQEIYDQMSTDEQRELYNQKMEILSKK